MFSKKFIITLCLLLPFFVKSQFTEIVQPNRKNSIEQQQKPYLIMISIDGFRYDYAKKYNAKNLLKYAQTGVSAEKMYASYPSKTATNHYTIITGLYPAHHGLVDNNFYDVKLNESFKFADPIKSKDGKWFGGTPLWVLAEKQQMVAASCFWVGSESNIQNTLPTYHFKFDDKVEIGKRIQKVEDWLLLPEEIRPHFITFYFSDVDHAGHDFGPDSPECEKAVLNVDAALGELVERVNKLNLPLNFIVVADHGMGRVLDQEPVAIDTSIKFKDFKFQSGSTQQFLYSTNKERVNDVYKQIKAKNDNRFKVFLKDEMPKEFCYRSKDDTFQRIGDIILMVNFPYIFGNKKYEIDKATHGFDPYNIDEMGTIFYGWGPAFKENLEIKPFKNIHVFPLAAKILGLEIKYKIDGKLRVLKKVLK